VVPPTRDRIPSPTSEEEVWDALGGFLRARQPWVRLASEAIGVPPPQVSVIVYLYKSGPSSAGAIARYMGVTPAAVTFVIQELDRRRYVEIRPGREDRRRAVVRLLPEGHRKVRQLLRWRAEVGHRALRSFSAAERGTLARLLRKFSHAMEAATPISATAPLGAGSNRPVARPPRARIHRDPSA
jgi:DNA-binding MarR family transcriptional regulator